MTSNAYRITLWVSVLGTLALVVAGMVWIANGGGQKPVYVPGVNEIMEDDHVFGKADSSVTVVEYADFQCPGCGEVYPILKKVEEDYGDRVRFVYRNFPIPGHPNGPAAAYAAEAAALQGKFFEMEDRIFTRQSQWSALSFSGAKDVFRSYAQEIGLDLDKFDSDRSSDAVKAKVEKDARSGIAAGVDSTPSFFLNGTKMQLRTYAYDEFSAKLDAALQP